MNAAWHVSVHWNRAFFFIRAWSSSATEAKTLTRVGAAKVIAAGGEDTVIGTQQLH